MIRTYLLIALACIAVSGSVFAQAIELESHVSSMKDNARGPFKRLRWFCNDGSVLPPKPYACKTRGGGVQHGEYSKKALAVRSAGYPIATLLADLTPANVVNADDRFHLLNTMLLERFLMGFDDGWIYRKARFYRGAIQAEDEQSSGQAILEAIFEDAEVVREHFVRAREAVRLLPHNRILVSLSDVRGLAASIAEQDPNFRPMRGKIHGRPDAGDAERVREYAQKSGTRSLRSQYKRLAALIDDTYAASSYVEVMTTLQNEVSAPDLLKQLTPLVSAASTTAADRYASANRAMHELRQHIGLEPNRAVRVSMMDASVELERIAFVAGRELLTDSTALSRTVLLQRLMSSAEGLYGAGLISKPEMSEISVAISNIFSQNLTLNSYRNELRTLALASEWANRQLHFHFGTTIAHMTDIEPLVDQYIPDRLRGSALLIYQELHDRLSLDAQSTSGVKHEVFGMPVASGLRSLNPGIVRGPLYFADHDTRQSEFHPDGIYVVPETLPRIPPVAGILTRSEGNALSHVQLLARNLGIPNIVVSEEVEKSLAPHEGKTIVIAASGGGVVRIAHNEFQWDNVFRGQESATRSPLQIDVEKLNLERRQLYSLRDLRSSDSGRVVGPKAAKLGELMHQFPGQVSPGVVIPFGVYRDLLDQPFHADSSESMRSWMAARYRNLTNLREEDPDKYATELEQTLEYIRLWIISAPLPVGMETELRNLMRTEFGQEGDYGVFVRSDTNVEDLPNFSGAGLNLTVPNVVGFNQTVAAIRRVWASPFSARAFAWRQALMNKPEHVYASVLLQVGVPAEKSGVLVSKDLTTGNPNVATVVVNEGVGGGVDGQLAETLKINLSTGAVRRMSSASAIQRTVLLRSGGVGEEFIRNSEEVLNSNDIRQLQELAQVIPQRINEFRKRTTGVAPAADVEFGFHQGKLWLFQIRPFVESSTENRNRYLVALDAGLAASAKDRVNLNKLVSGEVE